MEDCAMTVRDKIKEMVSTGFTGISLIVGTNLKELMEIVTEALDEEPQSDGRYVQYDLNSEYYSNLWYHTIWEITIRPLIAKYLDEHMPVCWYRVYYTPKLDVV